MEKIKDHLIPILLTVIITGLVSILVSLKSDILSIILPSLREISVDVYVKIIILLLIVCGVSIITITILLKSSKLSQPLSIKGKYYQMPWLADINYESTARRHDIEIQLYWLCPVHKTPVDIKQVGVMHTFFCNKCNKTHDIKFKGKLIPWENADKIVRSQIRSKTKNVKQGTIWRAQYST